jgi:hypothetical protein
MTTHEETTFPADRGFRIWFCPSMLLVLAILALAPLVAAWMQYLIAGLPPVSGNLDPAEPGPHGFPFWLRYSHYFNILFMLLIIRAGLSILMDHPRLYWNLH